MARKFVSVGDILRETRLKKGLKISEVATKTKIRESLIKDLEESNVQNFTSEMHFKSFLKSYGEFLGIDKEKIMALYRRERNIEEDESIHKKKGKFGISDKRTVLISNFFSLKYIVPIIGLLVMGVVIYFFIQFWISLRTPPNLEIISPAPNSIIETENFIIEGRTDGNDIKVYLDGIEGIYFDREDPTLFRIEAKFSTIGFRSFIVTAENQLGQTTQVNLDLIYEPPTNEAIDDDVAPSPTQEENNSETNKTKDITLRNNSPLAIKVLVTVDEEIEPKELTIEPENSLRIDFVNKLKLSQYDPNNLSLFYLDEETPLRQISSSEFLIEVNGSIPVITNLTLVSPSPTDQTELIE